MKKVPEQIFNEQLFLSFSKVASVTPTSKSSYRLTSPHYIRSFKERFLQRIP